MNEDRLNALRKQVDNSLECKLLDNLYPDLAADWAQKLCAQYKIDYYPGMRAETTPDFAFPDAKIAIYCDGYRPHTEQLPFNRDRWQSRELQLRGWIVLRFTDLDINQYVRNVVQTIQRAIARRERQQAWRKKRRAWWKLKSKFIRIWRYIAAVLGAGLLAAIVLLMIQLSKQEQFHVHLLGDVVLIPSGEFQMGDSDDTAEIDEHPVHTVHVDAFYIDKYEVTNAQYKKFVDANPQWQKGSILRKYHNGNYLKFWQGNNYPPGKENHPVVWVSWYAAMAYAKWTGKRLSTEAEWERAARGGLVGAKYSWGDEIDPTMANYGGELGDTQPVGSYPPNAYGLYDMTGNVMEWCLDAYDEGFYNHSPPRNPIAGGPLVDIVNNFLSVTNLRVVRSGCWYNVPMHVRVADRYGTLPENASKGRGFRCAEMPDNIR